MLFNHGEEANGLFLVTVGIDHGFINQSFQLSFAERRKNWLSILALACESPYWTSRACSSSAPYPSTFSKSIHICSSMQITRAHRGSCSMYLIGSITNPVADGTVTL